MLEGLFNGFLNERFIPRSIQTRYPCLNPQETEGQYLNTDYKLFTGILNNRIKTLLSWDGKYWPMMSWERAIQSPTKCELNTIALEERFLAQKVALLERVILGGYMSMICG